MLFLTPRQRCSLGPLTVFSQFRLILGEEAFLTGQLGEPYREYLRAVPRLIPRWHSNLPQADATTALAHCGAN